MFAANRVGFLVVLCSRATRYWGAASDDTTKSGMWLTIAVCGGWVEYGTRFPRKRRGIECPGGKRSWPAEPASSGRGA